LQCVAVCCSVLQCVAVCCVAVCCSVLQCVAVCCSVLQYVAHQYTPFVHAHSRPVYTYDVATITRLLEIKGLFCTI